MCTKLVQFITSRFNDPRFNKSTITTASGSKLVLYRIVCHWLVYNYVRRKRFDCLPYFFLLVMNVMDQFWFPLNQNNKLPIDGLFRFQQYLDCLGLLDNKKLVGSFIVQHVWGSHDLGPKKMCNSLQYYWFFQPRLFHQLFSNLLYFNIVPVVFCQYERKLLTIGKYYWQQETYYLQ